MESRGLIPVNNDGDGNCVFISLAQIVFGDPSKFQFMRYIIVQRLRNFPKKYQDNKRKFPNYSNSMIIDRRAATMLELQAIADICFSVVECYSTENFLMPYDVILPLRSE